MILGQIYDMDGKLIEKCKLFFEIVKIDVLEARDYVDRVPDVNLFYSPKGRLFSSVL